MSAIDWEIDVRIRRGDFCLEVELAGDMGSIAVIGPNGSGKSTLLKALAGGIAPERGCIRFGERILFSYELQRHVPAEARRVGYVPQGSGLFQHLSAAENVAFGLAVGSASLDRTARDAKVTRALSWFGAQELAGKREPQLSGGEQQRVALARAFVVEPQLVLLDEPLSALDVSSRRYIRSCLKQRLDELSAPAFIVSHDVRDVVSLASHVLVLDHGKVVQFGPCSEVRAEPCSAFAADFFDVAGVFSSEPAPQMA
jgi:ABC-type sulfate/molybdate transport systems ATPase subunit